MHSAFTCDRWAIGIVRAPIHAFLDPHFEPPVQWVGTNGPLEFLADCFGVLDGTSRFILAERFSYRDVSEITSDGRGPHRIGRGHITSIAIDSNGCVISEAPAIDTGRHMSFPYTVYDRGSWYLIAEEVSSGKLNLYRRDALGEWKHFKQLLPHSLIDAAVIEHAGRWWIFGTTIENPNSEVEIWCSDSLEGGWEPHARNPMRNSPYNTRSGGTPFLYKGCLYRPTQNCTTTYGGSIVINQIDVLTHDTFEEHAVRELRPLPGCKFQDGVHTLSSFGDWTLIDGRSYFVSPRVVIQRLIAKLGIGPHARPA